MLKLLFTNILLTMQLMPQSKIVDPLSAQSLNLITRHDHTDLGTATGFVVQHAGSYFLITNWHVVSGRDYRNDTVLSRTGLTPNTLLVWHHGKVLGNWTSRVEPLYDNHSNPRWKEHPQGKKIDVVALPLISIDKDVQIYPFDLSLANTDMIPVVAMPISIIGFPLGFSGAGKFPIWKTGHIATDPDLDIDGSPMFLIDATTRGGMSGSPVVLRLNGGFRTRSGNSIMSQSGLSTLFLGIFSAQHPLAEIGQVWRPSVIQDIFSH